MFVNEKLHISQHAGLVNDDFIQMFTLHLLNISNLSVSGGFGFTLISQRVSGI